MLLIPIFEAVHKIKVVSLAKTNFSGCTSQNSEYFQVSCNGEPQFELLTLLYKIYLNEISFDKLGTMVDSLATEDELSYAIFLASIGGCNCIFKNDSIQDANDLNKSLLTKRDNERLLTLPMFCKRCMKIISYPNLLQMASAGVDHHSGVLACKN